MTATDPWALELLAVAAAGGAFGAAIGALPSFSLAGLVVVLGELYALVGTTVGVDLPVDVTATIGFGPVLGPHVAFGGGAAAVAYAARRGYLDAGGEPAPAKRITHGLGSRPDVLAVGAAFGVAGHLVAVTSAAVSFPVDPIAFGVVASALLHRVALGYSPVGASPGQLFRDLIGRRPGADGGTGGSPWLAYQHRWRDVTGIGLAGGVLGAYVAYLTASPFLAFGLSVVALALLCAGVSRVPVTHHVTLPASTAALALAGAGPLTPENVAASVPLASALLVGAAFGLFGALAGEALQRLLYVHAETHLDPPAASIVVTTLSVATLARIGLLPSAVWIPVP